MRSVYALLLVVVAAGSASAFVFSSVDNGQRRQQQQSNSSVSSQYWTAYLNISYVDSDRNVYHTERTETGRFSSNGVREADGVAVEMLSEAGSSDGGAVDNTGCWPPFKQNYPTNEPWIAVVQRGKCTFNQKISNALSLNASGVLVFDNEDGGVLQSMKVERFSIPSVFTYRWKGLEILGLIRHFGRVQLVLQLGSHCRSQSVSGASESDSDKAAKILYCTPPASWDELAQILKKSSSVPYWNFNLSGFESDTFHVEKRTSVLFVSVSFIILLIISLAWLVFYYVQRFRYLHAKDRLERRLCSQAKRALAIISTSVLRKQDLEMKDFNETCAVCIDTFRVADVVRVLPCGHQFHKSCIDQWLLEKRTCPMCKLDLLKYYGMTDDANSDRDEAAVSLT